jgi:hypothetical protein
MKAKKKRMTQRDLQFMLFECHCHSCLDALGCPPGKYIGKRLTDWCELKGVYKKTAFGSEERHLSA